MEGLRRIACVQAIYRVFQASAGMYVLQAARLLAASRTLCMQLRIVRWCLHRSQLTQQGARNVLKWHLGSKHVALAMCSASMRSIGTSRGCKKESASRTHPDMADEVSLLVLPHHSAPVKAKAPVDACRVLNTVMLYWQTLNQLKAWQQDRHTGKSCSD